MLTRPGPARTVVVLAAVSLLAAAALLAMSRPADWIPFLCPRASGGVPGAQAQLQYLHVTDRSVTFSFVNSISGSFDVPEYTVEHGPDGPIAVSFKGSSIYEPDGTRSYPGPLVIEPGRQVIRQVRLSGDADRTMRWDLKLVHSACPGVTQMRYWTGSYSRAQVIVAFGDTSSVTLEPAVRPVGAPVWVNGAGFAPSTSLVLTANEQIIRETTTDAAGMFQTAIFVPEADPGSYVVVARDRVGNEGRAILTITDGRWP
jgi:hypothetical protein